MTNEKEFIKIYSSGLDLLRTISIIGVVFIHSLGAFKGSVFGSNVWWINNIIDTISHFCVPVFIMISGALLIVKDESIKTFYKKRFKKILLPFLFWSIVFFIGNIILDRPLRHDNYLIAFFLDLFLGGVIDVYWYIYMLIGLYLVSPIVSKWALTADNYEIQVYLFLWLIFNGLYVLGIDLVYFEGTVFVGYLGYYILGYYLYHRIEKVDYGLIILITIIVLFLSIIGNYLFPEIQFESYLNLNMVLYSTGVFLIFSKIKIYSYWIKIVTLLSRYSYSIYLIHAVFISILARLGVNSLTISPYIGFLIVSISTVLLSIGVTLVFSKNKISNQFVGV